MSFQLKVDEDVPGDKATIVLHPGSTHLLIGLSTDPTPHTIPHLIAYRKKPSGERVGGASVHDKEANHVMNEGYYDESLVLQHNNDITVSE